MTDFQTVAKNTKIASGSMKLVDLAGKVLFITPCRGC